MFMKIKHIDKIRLFNRVSHMTVYPDNSGHFYIHRINSIVVLDNVEIWPKNNHYSFCKGILQHCFGDTDENGQDIYIGDLGIWEIEKPDILQHTVWKRALAL